jgi:hypothetical protein
MAVSQHDEEARGRGLDGFDRKRNVLSEDVIHEVRQINDGFAPKEIGFTHHPAGLFTPDAYTCSPHSRNKIGRRAGAGRSRID